MKNLLLSCMFFMVVFSVQGYNSLRVGDPRNSWSTSTGTIEEATLSIRPMGLFTEFGLYLTFSSRGTYWTSYNDTLEVVLNFELPENAVVNDSWLYMKDYIVKAKILDKWSASSIYEGIVKRRKDPSILSKLSDTQYELRVFPMVGNESRKVKITYLVPTDWQTNTVSASLPVNILQTSRDIPDLTVLTWPDENWTNPYINVENVNFSIKSDTVFGQYQRAVIPHSRINLTNKIKFKSNIDNGLFFSSYKNGAEGIYQLAVFPEKIIDTVARKKILMLIDYDAANSHMSVNELISEIEKQMLNHLNEADSFNIMFSNLPLIKNSETWLDATVENINSAFSGLNDPLSEYSNMSSLLVAGIEFIKENGNDGKIILVSNADDFADNPVANDFINDLMAMMENKIPIQISEYQSRNWTGKYINGRYYYGNEYFYSNLSRITLGSYFKMRDGYTISETISESFKYISGAINSFDLYTKPNEGYCYSKYFLSSQGNMAYINEPITQIGKFKGTFPFKIELTGQYNNKILSHEIEIQEPNAFKGDSLMAKYWAGKYIHELENEEQNNNIIDAIIYNSMQERVLSKFTSFLCLENDDYVCFDCMDESSLTDIDAPFLFDTINVYPNPFNEYLNIDIFLSENEEIIGLSIIGLDGKIIHEFDTSETNKGKNTFSWTVRHANGFKIESGIYLVSYVTNRSSYTLKIIKQ